LGFSFFDDDPVRRTFGIRDRQILYERAGRKCQGCGRKISFTEMQVGHKRAFSKGGSTSFRNSACLCYGCNKLQGTDSWKTFHRKLGRATAEPKSRDALESLGVAQLKYLAKKHGIKPKGKLVDDWFDTYRKPPGKKQYISALSKVVSSREISAAKTAKRVTRRRRRRSSSWSFW